MMIAASTSRPTAIARPPSVIVFRPTPSGFSSESGQGDRQGNGERDDQRRPEVAEQQEDHEHDEDAAEHDGAADASERRVHELGLVVDDSQLHALRQRAPDVLDRLTDSCRDLDGVGPELLDDARADDFALEPVRDASADGGGLAHVGDVAEQDRARPRESSRPCGEDRRRSARGPSRARSTRSTPASTMPPEALRFDSSTACITSSRLMRRADIRSGSSCTWNCRR